MKKYERVKALVSLDAIAHNFEEMHKNVKEGTKIIAVIKADGYGHGARAIARLIQDYDYIWGFATYISGNVPVFRDGLFLLPKEHRHLLRLHTSLQAHLLQAHRCVQCPSRSEAPWLQAPCHLKVSHRTLPSSCL